MQTEKPFGQAAGLMGEQRNELHSPHELINGLVNDAHSISEYITLNGKTINEQ
jgi:hypothetical protein